MGTIGTIYNVLMELVTLNVGVFTKSDTNYYEQFPAIGFGIPTIESVGVIGSSSLKKIIIPVEIVDAGSHIALGISLSELYEAWEDAFKANIVTSLQSVNIEADVIDFGDYSPRPIGQDDSIRGLSGSVSFTIKI